MTSIFRRDQARKYTPAELVALVNRIRARDPSFDAIELFSDRYMSPTGAFDVRKLEQRLAR